LKSDLDIIRFLKRAEAVVQIKRGKEVQSEFESRKKQPRIGMNAPILIQASKVIHLQCYSHLTDQMVSCSCSLFERIGILCRHALKGLDLVNIKLLPERYFFESMDTRCKNRDYSRYAWEGYNGKS
jgi:hypothetical protein